MHLLAQQLPSIIKCHPEPHALEYLLKQLEHSDPTSDSDRSQSSRAVSQRDLHPRRTEKHSQPAGGLFETDHSHRIS